MLEALVRKYGRDQWRKVLRAGGVVFDGRTVTELRERWRSIAKRKKHDGRVEDEAGEEAVRTAMTGSQAFKACARVGAETQTTYLNHVILEITFRCTLLCRRSLPETSRLNRRCMRCRRTGRTDMWLH